MQLESMASDMSMVISRAKLLVTIARDRNTLVGFISPISESKQLIANKILQHLHTVSTAKMQKLTLLSHKESVVMRIITVVTLVFLPATFVSVSFMPESH